VVGLESAVDPDSRSWKSNMVELLSKVTLSGDVKLVDMGNCHKLRSLVKVWDAIVAVIAAAAAIAIRKFDRVFYHGVG